MLQIFISNDLPDNFPSAGNWNHYLAIRCGRPYFELTDGGVTQVSKPVPYASSGVDRILRNSRIYEAMIAPPVPLGGGPAFQIHHAFAENPPAVLEEAWVLTQRLILAIRDEARRHDMAFLVMIAPSKKAAGQPSPASEVLGPRFRRSYDRLLAFLRDRGIPHIDPLPTLREQVADGHKPYFERDSHWSAEGHRVVADVMSDWLGAHCEELGLPLEGCGGP